MERAIKGLWITAILLWVLKDNQGKWGLDLSKKEAREQLLGGLE